MFIQGNTFYNELLLSSRLNLYRFPEIDLRLTVFTLLRKTKDNKIINNIYKAVVNRDKEGLGEDKETDITVKMVGSVYEQTAMTNRHSFINTVYFKVSSTAKVISVYYLVFSGDGMAGLYQ